MENSLGRRETVKKIIGGSFVLPLMENFQLPVPLKGNIKHSVCKWCYGSIPLEEFAIAIKKMGINAIDLISIEQFPILKKHDIHCSFTLANEKKIEK